MMKFSFLLLLIFSVSALSAKTMNRKIGSSKYYACVIERDGGDSKNFRKTYHFPYPSEKGETYELKGSLRWNNYSIIFDHAGEVGLEFSEMMGGKPVTMSKRHSLGKDPLYKDLRVQLDLRHKDKMVSYHVSCGPE